MMAEALAVIILGMLGPILALAILSIVLEVLLDV